MMSYITHLAASSIAAVDSPLIERDSARMNDLLAPRLSPTFAAWSFAASLASLAKGKLYGEI